MKWILTTTNTYEIEADSEEEARIKLEGQILDNNSTPENEFWDNMEAKIKNPELCAICNISLKKCPHGKKIIIKVM